MDMYVREKCDKLLAPYKMCGDVLAKLGPLLEHLDSCDTLELALLYTKYGGPQLTPFTLSEMKDNLESVRLAHIDHAKDKIESILNWGDLPVIDFTWEVDMDIPDIRQLVESLVQRWQSTKKISDVYMESNFAVARIGYHEKLREYVEAMSRDVFYYNTWSEVTSLLDGWNNWNIMQVSTRLYRFDPLFDQDHESSTGIDKDACARRLSMFICLYIMYHCNNLFIDAF